MSRTPKILLEALDLVTADDVAAVETLASTERTHYKRVRTVFDDPNIIGAGVAEKTTEGAAVGALSLCFYVKRKLPKAKVAADHLLPPVMAGADGSAIFTDVYEIGEVVPQINKTTKPIKSGFSVGHKNITAGTLGAIVKANRKLCILSNSHVLADSGRGKKGDQVLYPGPDDGGDIDTNTVARLQRFNPFDRKGTFTNKLDAALAQVSAERLSALDLDITGAKKPLRIAAPVRGMKVIKRGRTTGDTESVVRDTDFRILVDYGDGVGVIGFTGQVRCDTYTAPGDSGALVIAKDSGAIVGLHFSGSKKGSVFTPIKTVMEVLKFRF
jgi:hypothetical protein